MSTLPASEVAETLLRVSGGLLVVTSDTHFLYVSPAWEACLGYTAEELYGRPICEFLHPDDVNDTRRRRAEQQVSDGFENRFIHKAGGYRWLAWQGTYKIEEHRFYGSAHDVTESHKVQERLREAQAAAQLGHWEFDMQRRISVISPELLALYGLPLTGGEMTEEDSRRALPPDVYAMLQLRAAEAAENKQPTESRFQRSLPDGTIRYFVVRTNPEFGPGGSVVRFWGTVQEITESAIHERKLDEARETAEQASSMKSQFLANTSHEIRTPLNAILNANELLLLTPLDSEQRDLVETALLSGRGLLGLLNSVLDLARIEAGKMDLELAPFDPARILGELVKAQQARARERHIELRLHANTMTPLRVLGDGLRFRQVMGNLLDNALKFTERGHIELGLATPASDGVQFWVKDTGSGIPLEKLRQIFEPFTQVDASDTRIHGGAGLGLAICREFVTLMGGTIDVDSGPESGTIFKVWLPLGRLPPREPSEPKISLPVSPARQLRILVAEDNDINAKVLVKWLEKKGHSAVVVGDGQKAVGLGLRESWDLILMDLQMPRLDGFAATRLIRSSPGGVQIPIVALTASTQLGEAERCRVAGMDDFLTKPVSFERLAALLESVGQGSFRPAI
jgi:PAS domain S-box-containing protein